MEYVEGGRRPEMYASGDRQATRQPAAAPWWGAEYKELLREYPRTMFVNGHTTSLPLESNSITIDPTAKDDWGVPAIRVTFTARLPIPRGGPGL